MDTNWQRFLTWYDTIFYSCIHVLNFGDGVWAFFSKDDTTGLNTRIRISPFSLTGGSRSVMGGFSDEIHTMLGTILEGMK